MIILYLIGCDPNRDSEDADSGGLEERETTLHSAAEVSAVLTGGYAMGGAIGGDLLGSGIPTVLVWGCTDNPNSWEEDAFLSVYSGDIVGRSTLSLRHGTNLVVPAESCSSASAMARPVGSSDLTGDGADDLLVTAAEPGGGVQLFAGPLPADGAWPAAVATIAFSSRKGSAPEIDAADLDGDGVTEVILFSRFETQEERLVVLDTPLSGSINADQAPLRLAIQDHCRGTYALAHGDVDKDGYEDLALACDEKGYLLKGPFTNAVRSLEDATSSYVFNSDASHYYNFFGSVAILTSANDAPEVAFGVPDIGSQYADGASGIVLLFDSLPGAHGAVDATGKIWGDGNCGSLGRTLAAGRMDDDGYDDLWMGAPGPSYDPPCYYSEDQALWGLRGPLYGEILASNLDEGFLNVELPKDESFTPYGLAVGDLDGTARDDLAVWNGSSVMLVRW